MLIFDASKNKKIEMAIESQGIDNDKLKFTFIIDSGKVSYGFPCEFNEGSVTVDIPALSEVIKDIKAGTYGARLDVTGDDKYYLKPFDEQVVVKLSPTIKKVEIKDNDVQESMSIMVSKMFESDGDHDKDRLNDKKVEEKKTDEKEEGKKSTKEKKVKRFFDK